MNNSYWTIIFGAVFEPFVNSGFDFATLQSDGNIKLFTDKLKI